MAIQTSPVNVEERRQFDIRPGDTVRVYQKVIEKGKTRHQPFEGTVIARKHGTEAGATFTVRRTSSGVGVERIFPLYSPNIDRIEVLRRARVRRAKLYYIRQKVAREIRRQMRRMRFMDQATESEAVRAQREAEEAEAAESSGEEQQEQQSSEEAATTGESSDGGEAADGADASQEEPRHEQQESTESEQSEDEAGSEEQDTAAESDEEARK